MIPERLVRYFHGPTFFHLGTRDRDLQPTRTSGFAVLVHDDRETVTVMVGTEAGRRSLANLADNGRVALGSARATHCSYQLKGTLLAVREASAEDVARTATYQEILWKALAELAPEELAKKYVLGMATRPATAITFRVEDVYQQTPGPGAGERITA